MGDNEHTTIGGFPVALIKMPSFMERIMNDPETPENIRQQIKEFSGITTLYKKDMSQVKAETPEIKIRYEGRYLLNDSEIVHNWGRYDEKTAEELWKAYARSKYPNEPEINGDTEISIEIKDYEKEGTPIDTLSHFWMDGMSQSIKEYIMGMDSFDNEDDNLDSPPAPDINIGDQI